MRLTRGRLWGIGAAAALAGAALVPLLATADWTGDRGLWIALTLVIGSLLFSIGILLENHHHQRAGRVVRAPVPREQSDAGEPASFPSC